MFSDKTAIWVAYLFAALATLAGKLIIYVRAGKKMGKPAGKCIKEWFLENSRQNIASWVATIGFVWGIGAVYIDRVVSLAGILGQVFDAIPVHASFALVLGYVAEMVAPNAAKWFISQLPNTLKSEQQE